MMALIPTPVCVFQDLRHVVYDRTLPSVEEMKNHPGERFDLNGLTTPVFDAETYEHPRRFGLVAPFEDVHVTAAIATGNQFRENAPPATGDTDLDAILLQMLVVDPAARLHGRGFLDVFSKYVRARSHPPD